MSELICNNKNNGIRRTLLTEASALALVGYMVALPAAKADDSDRPTVWIEIGGQFNRLQDGQEIYSPKFVDLTPSIFPMPQADERPPRYGFDEGASIVFQPSNSAWSFSAAVRYGRATSSKHVHHQTYPSTFYKYLINRRGDKAYNPYPPFAARFTDTTVRQSEGHTIVDFQVGKDVGLGLFGAHTESSLNAGIRFAQFLARSRISLREDPDWHLSTNVIRPPNGFTIQTAEPAFHSYAGSFSADRSFQGIGPSVSWTSSVPIVGNNQDGELTLDFGANGAVLFGRQKTKSRHQETGRYHPLGLISAAYPSYGRSTVPKTRLDVIYQGPDAPIHVRSRSVVAPNIGAFLGLSIKYPNVKVSLGYKADFFFGAMDGGIDVRRTEDVGFHGPYASVSIGLGG